MPQWLGAKNAFLGSTLNFAQTCLCNGTWYQQSERNSSIYRDFPTYPKIRWTLVHRRWERLAIFLTTPYFHIGKHCQPYRMAHGRYSRTAGKLWHLLCSGTTYSLEQQNARWAHAGLCHASGYSCYATCMLLLLIFVVFEQSRWVKCRHWLSVVKFHMTLSPRQPTQLLPVSYLLTACHMHHRPLSLNCCHQRELVSILNARCTCSM